MTVDRRFAFPLREGYEFITDPACWPQYWPNLISVAPDSRWSEPGDTARLTLKLLGRPTELVMILSRIEPYRLVEYASVQHGLPAASHRRLFADAEGGFDYRIVIELERRGGLRRPFDRVIVARAVERAARQTVENLERRFAELEEDTMIAWDEIAAGYDRTNTATQMWLGNEGLRRAGLRPGMRFLDVAAGSGALSIPAARLGARVLATDLSPAMLERLERRARDEGLGVETRVMDGHALDLDDDSFDVAGSQFGVMLFPDMPKGISELARVVKPGGRVLMTVYGDPHEIEFLGFFVASIQSVVPAFEGPPMDPLPLPFQLHDPSRLRAELEAAGLADVEVESITEATEFRSGEHLWDWLVHSNPIVGEILGELGLSVDQVDVARRALDEQVRDRAGGQGPAILTAPINVGVGFK